MKRNTGPFVDAEPVRRHVRELMAAGVAYVRLAQAADVKIGTINSLLYPGGKSTGEKINHENARRILAIRVGDVATGSVDATGAGRRLQALMAIGWPTVHLAHHLHLGSSYVKEIHRRSTVYASTAHAMARVYNELWNQRPEDHGVSQRAATRLRNYARAKGWPPPAAWDDDAIDDPQASPAEVAEMDRSELAAYRRQEIAHLAGFGIPAHEIAARLDMSAKTVSDYVRGLRTAA